MELTEWAINALKSIWLFTDIAEIKNDKGVVITRDVSRERNLAIGLINSNSPEDFYAVARQVCPVGTIIKDYDKDFWTELYQDKSKMCYIELTKSLIDERAMKSAKFLLEVLSRRNNNWKDQSKQVEVKSTAEGTNITFSLV